MDSPRSTVSSLSASEATQYLKDLLNVGKSTTRSNDSDISVSSALEALDYPRNNVEIHKNGVNGGMSATGDVMDAAQNISQHASARNAIPKQQIILQGEDGSNSFSVYGRDVDIVCSHASGLNQSTAGSNKVKINPVVNFEWEHKHYVGNLVAIHRNGINIAYVLKGKTGGIVRVINRKTAERALLKGFHGRVLDISFAHQTAVLLGAVDEIGNMFVYNIQELDGKIDAELVLQVHRPAGTLPSEYHRIIWCPYIPEEDEGAADNTDDVARLLVITHDKVAEMWNVDMVTRAHGSGPILPSEVSTGYLIIRGHTKPITDASFSPDGTALATASLDGAVKFFQVYLQDKSAPRCLHQWDPHDGKPVSSIAFLDDHKHPNPDTQFWKFAITGCCDNQEFKIWSCETWSCLQTLRFCSPANLPSNFQAEPCVKMAMDLSANYMLLSDTRRKVLYVLQIYQDSDMNRAHVCSISEFLLTQPCLSFAILDASRRRFSRIADKELGDLVDVTTGEITAEEDDEEVVKDTVGPEVGVLIKMYSIHTRAMQELQIRFKPESSTPEPPPSSIGSISQDGFRDHLSDVSMETTVSDVELAMTGRSNMSQASIHSDHSSHSSASHHSEAASMHTDLSTASKHSATSNLSGASNIPTQELGNISGASSIPPQELGNLSGASHVLQQELGEQSPRSTASPLSERSKNSDRSLPQDLMLSDRSQISDRMEDPLNKSGSVQSKLSDFSYQSEQSKDSPEPKPVLLTPDAFISHKKGTIPLTSSELVSSPASSHTSSLTAVTAMDDDPLRTPAASVAHTQPSPSSSATLTPTSSRDLSGSHVDTPSSMPLPPVTPGEADALATPPSARTQGLFPPLTSSPLSTVVSSMASPPVVSASLPSMQQPRSVEELFTGKARGTLESTESSSSTSLEVSEILEGVRQSDADLLELEQEEEEEVQKETDVGQSDEDKFVMASTDVYEAGAWPEPPDMGDVNREAQRLASEAIQRAATLHSHQQSKESSKSTEESLVGEAAVCTAPQGAPEEPPTSLDVPQQAEDDVQIEEDKDEEEEEDLEQPPIATSSLAGDYDEEHGLVLDGESSAAFLSLGQGGHERQYVLDSSGDHVVHHLPQQPAADMATVKQMQVTLQEMVSLLHSQQRELASLRYELNEQRSNHNMMTNLQSHMESLEGLLEAKVAGALSQHSLTENQRLHRVLTEKESQEQRKHDLLLSTVSQTLDKTIAARLDKTIREEMRSVVMPGIARSLEPVKAQIASEISQKLTATDSLVKENVAKIIRSRQAVEAIGQSVGNAMQGQVQGVCRDILMPGFDRSCNAIFQQVNDTFQKGTQDHLQQLQTHLEAVRLRQEQSRDPIVAQIQGMVDNFKRREESRDPVYSQVQTAAESLKKSNQQLNAVNRRIEEKLDVAITSLEERMVEKLQRIVQEEVNSAIREQQTTISDNLITAMRSGAMTPSVTSHTPDPQRQQADILQLLQQGQLNAAFQQALSAVDLSLVMFVCEYVDPAQVFSQAVCPLEQPVLLSLIQQLSADLENNTELKHKYLEEAVMNLDSNNTVTREHMPAILSSLVSKLKVHIQTHPQDKMTRALRMLLMASQSLLQ